VFFADPSTEIAEPAKKNEFSRTSSGRIMSVGQAAPFTGRGSFASGSHRLGLRVPGLSGDLYSSYFTAVSASDGAVAGVGIMDRTNNTLSASTNRLNLGVRSLTLRAAVDQDSLRQCSVIPFRDPVKMPVGIHASVGSIPAAHWQGFPHRAPKPEFRPGVGECRPCGSRKSSPLSRSRG
jgi:hypothetical protein